MVTWVVSLGGFIKRHDPHGFDPLFSAIELTALICKRV
jgi:hypothetical protein